MNTNEEPSAKRPCLTKNKIKKVDKDEIIEYLRDILSDLHWGSCKCNTCGWVDFGENRGWILCEDCCENVCKECALILGAKEPYVCEECDEYRRQLEK